LPLEIFLYHLRAGSLPADAVALTFDDGYRDMHAEAWPVLRDLNIPATLFLATGPMRQRQRYWWDELVSLVLDAPSVIDETISIGASAMRINFGRREDADDDRSGWHAWDPPRTAREATYVLIWEALRVLATDERSAIMDRLRERLPPAPDEGDVPMSADEVMQVTAGGLVTLGGHTHEHLDLCSLEPAEAFADIARGKAEVERLSCRPAIAFAYPYGGCNRRVRGLVREAGFKWACATDYSSIDAANTDPLQLPRIAAPDQPEILID
jgi:peptidoglycan/xylan/chitin deacetylase (PgdA/CDA1 family)